MKEKKKAAIFDLDGTLVDAYRAITCTFNDALETMGYPPVPIEKVRRSVGGGSAGLASRFVRKEDVPKLMDLYGKNYAKFLAGRVGLLEGCEGLLEFLSGKGIKLCVATNRSRYTVPGLLDELKIGRYFDIICTADDVVNPKPDPGMIISIMDACGANPGEVFYTGDMDIDFFTGRNAGVDTYIVSTGSTPREDLEKIGEINLFDNLVSLKSFLEGSM